MYLVSDAYKSAIQNNSHSFTWSGTIKTTEGREYSFTDEDIVKDSGYVSFLDEQVEEITEYSDLLVRRLIEKITVYDEMILVEFKSGLQIEVDE